MRVQQHRIVSDRLKVSEIDRQIAFRNEEKHKHESIRLSKDLDLLRRKLIDTQREGVPELEKLRNEVFELRQRLIEEQRLSRAARIQEQVNKIEEAVRKQLGSAMTRAEELDKKLQERVKHYNNLYAQHRDTKT